MNCACVRASNLIQPYCSYLRALSSVFVIWRIRPSIFALYHSLLWAPDAMHVFWYLSVNDSLGRRRERCNEKKQVDTCTVGDRKRILYYRSFYEDLKILLIRAYFFCNKPDVRVTGNRIKTHDLHLAFS